MHREVQRNLGRLGLPSGHADGLESAHKSQPTSGPRSVSSLFNVSPALSLRRWKETSSTHTQEVSAGSSWVSENRLHPLQDLCCFLVRVTRMVRAGCQ